MFLELFLLNLCIVALLSCSQYIYITFKNKWYKHLWLIPFLLVVPALSFLGGKWFSMWDKSVMISFFITGIITLSGSTIIITFNSKINK